MNGSLATNQSAAQPAGKSALCFVVDTDFGYLKEFAKSLRSMGLDTIEMINSSRLGENVDNHNPAVVFVNFNDTNPCDCVRALFALKESKYSGRVQLMGKCEPALLDSYRKIGGEAGLSMLAPLQKPIDLAVIRKMVHEQKLSTQSAAPPELSLKKALASNWIQFWYQPQVELSSRLIVGAETFVRVAHPQHGMLSPARFMGGANDDDLTELAARALASALGTSAKLFNAGASVKIAINISVDTLVKLPIAEMVQKYAPKDSRWPGITLDVAETQVLGKMMLLKSKVPELQKSKTSIAVDNFGRGNSSFEVFRHLPIAEVKIDRSFVNGCAENKIQANICKSMIQFAHNFASEVDAVGIETDADALALGELGCDLGQGYLFGKPMSVEQLLKMMQAAHTQASDKTRASTPEVAAALTH